MNLDIGPQSHWMMLIESPSWVVRSLCCSTLMIAVTWMIVLSAKHRSAAFRHRLFSLGFAGLLVVPLAIGVTEGWNPRISVMTGSANEPVIRPSRMAPPSDAVVQNVDGDEVVMQRSETRKGSMDVPSDPQENTSQVAVIPDQPMATEGSAFDPESHPSINQTRLPSPDLKSLLVFVWAAGVLLLSLRYLIERHQIRRIIRTAVPVTDPRTVSLLQSIRSRSCSTGRQRTTDFSGSPQLLCHSSTAVPIVAGIVSPKILLPVGYGKWETERLRIVLRHELAHIDRRDLLFNVVSYVACTVYWFNPLVWLAARRMHLERELACDDLLLQSGESADGYATSLVEIAAAARQRLSLVQLATPMATSSGLPTRIQHLMNVSVNRQVVSRRLSWITAIVTLSAVIILAEMTPSFGIERPKQSLEISSTDETSVTLSGEFPSDWLDRLKAIPRLQKLTVRNPSLQNLKIAQLRELTNLTEFRAEDFSMETKLADLVAVNLSQLPGLKSVQFHRTGLTGRGLGALSRSRISELVLDGEELLTEADFKLIADMPELRTLTIDSTPIEAEGLWVLQKAPGLRRLVLARHPSGSHQASSESRVTAIAGFPHLEQLELADTGYNHLIPLKACPSLRVLTLRNSGADGASKALQQLLQLKRVELDNCDIRNESLDDVKTNLAKLGIELVDVTRHSDDLLTRAGKAPDEGTLFARRALDQLNVGRHFPAFWIGWHQHWSDIPSMKSEPVRSVHRLKQALVAPSKKRPWGQTTQLAYAPDQFFLNSISTTDDVATWQRVSYGDPTRAWSREGATEQPPIFVVRAGVADFEDSLGLSFPRQLMLTHQQMWWGTPTHYNITSSSVSPEQVAYLELAEETFAGEACRVFQAPGRSEQLWISTTTGRLRGVLDYIHQGYFTPFYQQDVVTRLVGRRITSNDDYALLFKGPNAVSKEVRDQLSQAWAEHEFYHAYPGNLIVLDDYREIDPGHWFPFKVTTSGWLHNEKNQGRYDFLTSETVVTEVAVDRNDLQRYWNEYQPNPGDRIQDQRFGVAVDFKFDATRTEADIQVLVDEQMLEYGRAAILTEQAESPFRQLIGKPAPPLPATGWVGTRPDVAGKRYLIQIWAAWCGPCKNDIPVLNALAKDRIIIGFHPADTPLEQVEQAMSDSKMQYPTAVAPRGAKDVLGYPAKMFPYYVEVDEQGNIAKHGFLEDVLTVPLRGPAGAKRPPQVTGKVLQTDDKTGLLVLSVGEADGIEANEIFDVVRNEQSISQVRVSKLYKDRSVAKIRGDNKKGGVQIGDSISRAQP
jgi:beta-lactamase regulating signal transducer with metallopeptidase domain/thiol-disulfide isomerase/thioredoxin